MNRADVEWIIREARASGVTPDLGGAYLHGANLPTIDLCGADLHWVNFGGANLYGSILTGSTLCGADLRGADLRWVDLDGANLFNARWDGLRIDNLPSGQLTLVPTCYGWQLTVGCWEGTVDELEALALSDDEDDWPEARGEEIARRRPLLLAAIAMCRAHIDANPNVVEDLAERWGTTEKEES